MLIKPLALADYLNMDMADIGLVPNIGYGEVPGVRAHGIVTGATAALTADITASDVSITLDSAARFPSPPFTMQIDYERLRVTGVAGNVLSVTRGYDATSASAHKKNKTVFEVISEYIFLVSPSPVKAINRVYIDGRRQHAGFTAYTGRSGDEHPDWPGRAVVAFSADAWISRQRNLTPEKAVAQSTGEDVFAVAGYATSNNLIDGSSTSYLTVSPSGVPCARVGFTEGRGTPIKQVYVVNIENTTASEQAARVVVQDAATGAGIIDRTLNIPASTRKTFSFTQVAGSWQTVLSVIPRSTSFKVYSIIKTVTREQEPGEDDALSEQRVGPVAGPCMQISLSPATRFMAWAAYEASGPGEVWDQTHYADLMSTAGATVKLISTAPDGTGFNISTHSIAAGATATIEHDHSGGGWDTMTKLVIVSGDVRVADLYKTVRYTTETSLADKSDALSSSARAVLGESVTVDAEWAVDETGDYAGAGTLIERPDHVIRHWLLNFMGFSADEIDQSSFDAAGAEYATLISGGYRFCGVLTEKTPPSETLRRMAREACSTIAFVLGQWRLNVVPDAAPAALKTITAGELAGDGAMFSFRHTPIVDLANNITVRYARAYTPGLHVSDWDGTVNISDAPSQSIYGDRVAEVELLLVRSDAMAQDIAAHMLLERKAPLLIAEFPVFWEHFDLAPGDTIDITNPLYNGKKFFIEEIRRIDQATATVRAIEWWA